MLPLYGRSAITHLYNFTRYFVYVFNTHVSACIFSPKPSELCMRITSTHPTSSHDMIKHTGRFLLIRFLITMFEQLLGDGYVFVSQLEPQQTTALPLAQQRANSAQLLARAARVNV